MVCTCGSVIGTGGCTTPWKHLGTVETTIGMARAWSETDLRTLIRAVLREVGMEEGV